MTDVAQAQDQILARIDLFPAHRQPLSEAIGRVLREEVRAERDQPPFDRVTMDGIAIAHRDWLAGHRRFRVVGIQAAGSPALEISVVGECVEVMTGSVLPAGTDSVVPVERIRVSGDQREIDPDAAVARHQYVHARGSDRDAGSPLISAGCLIGPAEIAVLASAGCAEVLVTQLPRIAVVSTGDELVDVQDPLAPYQIRSTNDRAVEASLKCRGVAQVTRARLKDEPRSMLAAIKALHATHDALILSGGVSMGQYDFVPQVLEEIGAKKVFHRIEQRPGKPMWFGMSGHKPVFALPGNPVSTLVCLTRYVHPALRQGLGLDAARIEWVRLTAETERSPRLTYFTPVRLSSAEDAIALAEPRPTNTSGDFVSLLGTDGFVELTPNELPAAAGDIVRFFRW
jgi:molybdopterin molybdotransferase